MQKIKSSFKYSLFISLLFTGCLKVQKKQTQQQPNVVVSRQNQQDGKQDTSLPISALEVQAKLVGLENPNLYELVFSWPKTTEQLRILVDNKVIFESSNDANEYHFENLVGGQSYNLLIQILNKRNKVTDQRIETIVVPMDQILYGEMSLNENLIIKADRVFLINTKIYTNEFNLKIETKEIKIQNHDALIQNFKENNFAAINTQGKSGGRIVIMSDSIVGSMQVVVNAQRGGRGLGGLSRIQDPENCVGADLSSICLISATSCFGGNGASSGVAGELYLKAKNLDKAKINLLNPRTFGGEPGPHGDELLGSNYPRSTVSQFSSTCQQPGKMGEGAEPGKICLYVSEKPSCWNLSDVPTASILN